MEYREEKLIILFLVTALLASVYHVGTTNERMARDGYSPYSVYGNAEVFWKKSCVEAPSEQPVIPAF